MVDFTWTCPFCFHSQVATESNYSEKSTYLSIGVSKYGLVGLGHKAIRCLNSECNEVFLQVEFEEHEDSSLGMWKTSTIEKYIVRPESSARTFPDFIPSPLRNDYVEACRIKNLSPKASATLARRCLQGVIRDFCQISKATLDAEIKELGKVLEEGRAPHGVTHESVEAIDHVRKIGNIGAHMERDINLIIDIDEGEAQALIELIEILFEDWYIARENRAKRLERVREIRAAKDAQKSGSTP